MHFFCNSFLQFLYLSSVLWGNSFVSEQCVCVCVCVCVCDACVRVRVCVCYVCVRVQSPARMNTNPSTEHYCKLLLSICRTLCRKRVPSLFQRVLNNPCSAVYGSVVPHSVAAQCCRTVLPHSVAAQCAAQVLHTYSASQY